MRIVFVILGIFYLWFVVVQYLENRRLLRKVNNLEQANINHYKAGLSLTNDLVRYEKAFKYARARLPYPDNETLVKILNGAPNE